MTSPRYPDVEEAWGRFLDGQPRAAAARLSEIVRSGAREGSGFDRRLAALEALGSATWCSRLPWDSARRSA